MESRRSIIDDLNCLVCDESLAGHSDVQEKTLGKVEGFAHAHCSSSTERELRVRKLILTPSLAAVA